MPDLSWLADLGLASTEALWLPVLAWSAVALVAEAALRLSRAGAPLALPVRGALLAALPLAVAAPAVVRWLAPEAPALTLPVDLTTWLPEVTVGAAPAPAEAVVAPGPPLGDVLLGLAVVAVVAVTLAHALRLGAALATVRRTRRALPAAGPDACAAVDRARAQLGVARAVATAEAPVGAAPFTVGVRRPLVALPADLGGEARELAALHEVAHVRRADAFWHAAQRAVAALFGAHPLVWVLGRGLDLDRERAADAAVLAARPDQRRAYADLLFSYAALPAPPLALGAARGSSSLKTRIDAMTTPLPPAHVRRLARWGRLAGALALVVTAGLAAIAAPAPPRADLAFALVAPAYEVDGQPVAAGGSTSAEPFGYYVFELDGVGRFVVGAAPFPGSRPTGAFDGPTLRADAGGHTLVIRSAEPVLRGDDAPTTAHVRFEPWPAGVPALPGGVSEALPLTLDGLPPVGTPHPMEALLLLAAAAGDAPIGVRRHVEGAVTDADTGAPVVAATLQVVGTGVGATTGPDGRYRLDAPDGDQTVRVARSGYETRTVALADGQTELNVALTAANVPPPRPIVNGPTPLAPDVFEVVEEMPQMVGGLAGLQARVQYPPLARNAGIEGQVVLQFIVDEEGRVTDPVVLRSPHEMLAEAALQAVRGSTFTPGRQRGEAVKVRFAVPITFRLPAGDGVDRGEAGRSAPRPDVFEVVEEMPRLIGGLAGLQGRVVYPPAAKDAGAEGTVVVQFIVDEGGRVEDATVLRSPDAGLSEAALAAVRASSFEPGRQGGEAVKTRFAVPITFRLPAGEE